MTMQALPGSALEVIETKFFFQLLVSLLADPSRLDGSRQGAQVRRLSAQNSETGKKESAGHRLIRHWLIASLSNSPSRAPWHEFFLDAGACRAFRGRPRLATGQ